MPEIEHSYPPPAAPAPVGRDPFHLAPRGFVRATLVPIGVVAAVVGAVAAVRHQWGHLVSVAVVVPIAVLLDWALSTRAAARRGAGIHPVARTVAAAVLGVGIVAGLVLCALALVAPEVVGLATAGGVR